MDGSAHPTDLDIQEIRKMKTILQINMTYHGSQIELEESFAQAVGAIASFPGLAWKIWIINDETKEAGGLYCFDSETALTQYINSPIIAHLKTNPMVSNLQIKEFGAIAPLTAQTRGPIRSEQPIV
jgi:hypothetical protein